MLVTLISFLGGSAFRLIFGAVSDWFTKKQDHQHEMDLQRLQSELEAARHTRDLERIKLQADLGVREIIAQADAIEKKVMTDAFLEAVRATNTVTGIRWVDAWNHIIRPCGASISLLVWVVAMGVTGFILDQMDWALISAFLGVFVGDRIHIRSKL